MINSLQVVREEVEEEWKSSLMEWYLIWDSESQVHGEECILDIGSKSYKHGKKIFLVN